MCFGQPVKLLLKNHLSHTEKQDFRNQLKPLLKKPRELGKPCNVLQSLIQALLYLKVVYEGEKGKTKLENYIILRRSSRSPFS